MAATPISSAQFDAPAPRHLNWMRREGTSWCGLYDVCLEGVRDIGVFVIWHASDPRRWVKVGQGHIADCIAMQRDDFAIARYRHLGLHVAWAAVSMLVLEERDLVRADAGDIALELATDRVGPDAEQRVVEDENVTGQLRKDGRKPQLRIHRPDAGPGELRECVNVLEYGGGAAAERPVIQQHDAALACSGRLVHLTALT